MDLSRDSLAMIFRDLLRRGASQASYMLKNMIFQKSNKFGRINFQDTNFEKWPKKFFVKNEFIKL